MFDQSILALGALKLDALVLARGETCVEVVGRRAIALILVSGEARCNGTPMVRWRHTAVTDVCRLEAVDQAVIARVVVDGDKARHLGNTP